MPDRHLTRAIGAVVTAGSLLCQAPATAQLSSWRLGDGGVTWQSEAASQVAVVPVGQSLQPLQIQPGRNLTQQLAAFGQTWLVGPPADFRTGGLPRVWTNSNAFNRLTGAQNPLKLVDGDDESGTGDHFKSEGNPAGTAFFLDLGAPYPANRIAFRTPASDSTGYLRAFEISVSSGSDFDDSRQPRYTRVARVEGNLSVAVDTFLVDSLGTTTLVRFVQVKNLSRSPFSLAEVQVFGDGFVPAASYQTGLHAFDSPVNFGRLRIRATRLSVSDEAEAEAPPTCVLRMRSGADLTPLSYFSRDRLSGLETEVTEAEYAVLPRAAFFRKDPETGQNVEEVAGRDAYVELPAAERGEARELVPGAIRTDVDNWSPWSTPIVLDSTGTYDFEIDLPAPRQYLQLQAVFTGDGANAMGLDLFDVEFSPLLAAAAVGEVSLVRDPMPAGGTPTVAAGVVDTFSYDIVVSDPVAPGFSGIEVSAFPPPRFESLTIGNAPVAVVAETVTDDGFVVRFDPVTAANNGPIRVVFRQSLLEHSTLIRAWLVRDETVLKQPVAAGNANDLVTSNQIIVYSANPAPGVRFALSSRVVTPNGDLVNDEIAIDYSLIQFSGDVDVHVEVFDLAGRRVRELVSTEASAGDFTTAWNGRDQDRNLVPPGTYLCRIRVEATARDFTETRALGVAY